MKVYLVSIFDIVLVWLKAWESVLARELGTLRDIMAGNPSRRKRREKMKDKIVSLKV